MTQGPRRKGLQNHLHNEGGFCLSSGSPASPSWPSSRPVVKQGHVCQHPKGTGEQGQRRAGFSHSWEEEAGSLGAGSDPAPDQRQSSSSSLTAVLLGEGAPLWVFPTQNRLGPARG